MGTTGKRGLRCGCGFTTTDTSAFFEHKQEERANKEPWPGPNGLRPTRSNPNRHLDPRAARAKSDTAKSRKHREMQKVTSERWREATGTMPKEFASASVPPREVVVAESRARKLRRLESFIMIGQAGVPYSDRDCSEIGSLCDDLGLEWSRVFHGLDKLE